VQAGRDAEAQAAALRERGRIARDLHDVLAHSLAGLSVQLQAVRALATREGVGPTVLAPLDKAAALAQDGLAEARQAVASLRDPVGLGLAEVPALVQRHPGEAHLQINGTPGAVTAECGHAIYRAVQESLTNAARYAPGSSVQVALDWTAERLQVRVDDAGLPRGRSPIAGTSTGLGLAGMDERVRQAGGTLQAGPRPDGGWRVEITVPLHSETAAS
jgi:signal transduction histidine kinase